MDDYVYLLPEGTEVYGGLLRLRGPKKYVVDVCCIIYFSQPSEIPGLVVESRREFIVVHTYMGLCACIHDFLVNSPGLDSSLVQSALL